MYDWESWLIYLSLYDWLTLNFWQLINQFLTLDHKKWFVRQFLFKIYIFFLWHEDIWKMFFKKKMMTSQIHCEMQAADKRKKFANSSQDFSCWSSRQPSHFLFQCRQNQGSGGGTIPPQILAGQLTLSQSERGMITD